MDKIVFTLAACCFSPHEIRRGYIWLVKFVKRYAIYRQKVIKRIK